MIRYDMYLLPSANSAASDFTVGLPLVENTAFTILRICLAFVDEAVEATEA